MEQLVGTLQSGWMGIGGESASWALMTGAGPIEVDISRVRDNAQALDGMQVRISGRVIDRQYVERGAVRVLLAETIVQDS
jgi:hypothetical protein